MKTQKKQSTELDNMKRIYSYLTIFTLFLGIIVGLNIDETPLIIDLIGSWYIRILKIFITPVLFTSISITIYRTSKKKNKLIVKSIILFTLMYVLTFILTSIIASIVNPANNFIYDSSNWDGEVVSFNIGNTLTSLLPNSLVDVFVNPKVFFIIVIAYIFGKICSYINKTESLFIKLSLIKKYIDKAFEYFMYVTPIATFCLITTNIAKYGYILLGVGAKYIFVAYACGILTLLLIMMLPVFLIKKINPIDYIKKVYKVWIITLTTCSSAATLPYTVKVCKQEFNVDSEVTDVVVPLGCTIHMCGGAISFALLGLFCAKLYGIEINAGIYLLMLLSSLLINMSAPGIPGGGIVIGATFLQLFSIPLGFIGFYSGIYKFLDMCYTTLNVTGDISANILLNSK